MGMADEWDEGQVLEVVKGDVLHRRYLNVRDGKHYDQWGRVIDIEREDLRPSTGIDAYLGKIMVRMTSGICFIVNVPDEDVNGVLKKANLKSKGREDWDVSYEVFTGLVALAQGIAHFV